MQRLTQVHTAIMAELKQRAAVAKDAIPAIMHSLASPGEALTIKDVKDAIDRDTRGKNEVSESDL